MARRQSIPNIYENVSGVKFVPSSYQPELFPMSDGPVRILRSDQMESHYRASPIARNNSFHNNRVVPHRQDYNPYVQSNSSFQIPSSTTPLYSKTQLQRNAVYPHSSPQQNDRSTPQSSKELCCGIKRNNCMILFGGMAILAAAAIGGLITSTVLYLNDAVTDAQWKIFGMAVCSLMLGTILVTLCLFIYCLKSGHITNSDEKENDSDTPQDYLSDDYFRRPNDYYQPYDRSLMPYGMSDYTPPLATNRNIIHVHDKQTNTEASISPIRPRDINRGVWSGVNAYGGLSSRSTIPPSTVNHYIHVLPKDIDQSSILQQRNTPITIMRQSITEQPYYELIEEIYEAPQR